MSDVTVPAPQMEGVQAGQLMTSQEALVHGLVGAQYGDLEFDVGKSVRWTQWFTDDIFITDVNLGTPRYWIVNWTETFPEAHHTVTGINWFVVPKDFRKQQFTDAMAHPAILLEPNDWVIFIDAHEALCIDTRPPLPTDVGIEPFRSYLYREISRATTAGRDRVVLPYYAFLKHADVIVADYPSPAFEDGTLGYTTAQGSLGTPYYVPNLGLTRLFKVSVLQNPAFDWGLLDTPVPWEVKQGTGTPFVAATYLNPAISRATTPDLANWQITADTTFVAKVRVKSLTDAAVRMIASHRPGTATNMDWHLALENSNQLTFRVSTTGTAMTSSAAGATLTGQCNPGDDITIAASIDIDDGAAGHTITYRMLLNSVWTVIGTSVIPGVLVTSFNSTVVLSIGGSSTGTFLYDDQIYWAEARTGLDPAAGTLIWRMDPVDYVTGLTFPSNGRTWTLTNPTAIVKAGPAVPAAPAINTSIVSYAYAHWNIQDIVPPATTVEPLSEANDDGWRMRKLISMIRPIASIPYTEPYQSPATDPPGTPGPWAPADPVTPDPIQSQPVTPDPTLSHLLVGLYDNVIRLNLRDGVYYEGDENGTGLGNLPLKWDPNKNTWVPSSISAPEWKQTEEWVAPVS